MAKQCTKCKKIYEDDSLAVCPDCKMGLITIVSAEAVTAEKEEAPAPEPAPASSKEISVFSLTNEESAQRVVEYLKEQGIDASYQFVLRERIYKIYVSQENAKAALRAYTAFYAVEAKRLKEEEDKRRAEEEAKRKAEEEAKRKAEEEARRKAEEEERRRIEEEERRKRIEEERIRAQEEAILAAEEEARRKREEAEHAKAEAEAKIRAAEEAKIKAAQEAKEKAEKEAQAKLAEVEKLKAQAEEARRKAEEAKKRVEEEAKRRAEEERQRAAEEAIKRKAEEERRRQEESEQRRNRFAESFRMADDAPKASKKTESFNFEAVDRYSTIPKVDAEAVSSSSFNEPNIFSSPQPENGPIFVETEPVDEYNIGDTIIVDAVEVEPGEDIPEPAVEASAPETESYNDFFSSIKKDKFNSVFGDNAEPAAPQFNFDDDSSRYARDDEESRYQKEDVFESRYEREPEPLFTEPTSSSPVVEDMFSDNLFSSKKEPATDNKVVEEVINDNLKESGSDRFKSAFEQKEKSGKKDFASMFEKMDNGIDDIDDGTYKGFVPDYHEDTGEEDADTKLAQSYGFDPEAYKKLKEKTEKNIQDRKNAPKVKKKEANPDFVVMDEIKVDDYQGFVPDYGKKNDSDMQNYTSRIEIDYSKYRKGGAGSSSDESNSLASLTGTLRSTNQYELNKLYAADAVKNSAQPQDFTALKSTNFILALTGGQLNSLFTSWLITNCTKTTVKQYEKATAGNEENYNNKIEGIKSLLRSNFGKLDEYALDIIVKRFYNKYLDE